MRERHFTLDEAKAQLPWLEEVFARVVPMRDQLEAQQGELLSLLRQRGSNGATSKDQEIGDLQRTVDELTGQIKQELEEINLKGIIVRDLGRGLVDFRSERDGQEIFLCWLRGEGDIGYWHGTNEGFGSRKRI